MCGAYLACVAQLENTLPPSYLADARAETLAACFGGTNCLFDVWRIALLGSFSVL